VELKREDASVRRLLRSRSAWDFLLDAALTASPSYERYSYAARADLFRSTLTPIEGQRLFDGVLAAAQRRLRGRLSALPPPTAIVFHCPRLGQPGSISS
jgi:hypothetical protein